MPRRRVVATRTPPGALGRVVDPAVPGYVVAWRRAGEARYAGTVWSATTAAVLDDLPAAAELRVAVAASDDLGHLGPFWGGGGALGHPRRICRPDAGPQTGPGLWSRCDNGRPVRCRMLRAWIQPAARATAAAHVAPTCAPLGRSPPCCLASPGLEPATRGP